VMPDLASVYGDGVCAAASVARTPSTKLEHFIFSIRKVWEQFVSEGWRQSKTFARVFKDLFPVSLLLQEL